jgi:hypothetical protein
MIPNKMQMSMAGTIRDLLELLLLAYIFNQSSNIGRHDHQVITWKASIVTLAGYRMDQSSIETPAGQSYAPCQAAFGTKKKSHMIRKHHRAKRSQDSQRMMDHHLESAEDYSSFCVRVGELHPHAIGRSKCILFASSLPLRHLVYLNLPPLDVHATSLSIVTPVLDPGQLFCRTGQAFHSFASKPVGRAP